MSEPRRPDPDRRWADRLRERVKAYRAGRGFQQAVVPGAEQGDPIALLGRQRDPSLVVMAAIALGSAALALGCLWAWQTWSQRSQAPIDDLLPVLVVDSPGVEAIEAPAQGDEDSDGQPTTSAVPVQTTPVQTTQPVQADEPNSDVSIVVHVSGAVRRPGVVDVPAGSRLFEVVELAGGATDVADLDRVNLAAPLVDGERIHVPAVGEEVAPLLVQPQRPAPTPGGPSTIGGGDPTVPSMIDLNGATARDLEALPGVGPATAQAIVRTRDERGPFLAIDELLEVPGIGDAKLALVRPYVVIGGS